MNCIVIKKGKYFHFTYSSVRWNQYGRPTDYNILTCEDWKEGLRQVQSQDLVLFIDSGTVFHDIESFVKDLEIYPHQGLIGHIIDPLDSSKFFSLHPQCFLLDPKKFSENIFVDEMFDAPATDRSERNIHDDYTPLWLRPGKGSVTPSVQTDFGQKIIAQQIASGKIVSNLHQKLRGNKIFLYRDELRDDWIEKQKPYFDLAEKHLWILNNQPTTPMDTPHLVCPASGLYWMLELVCDRIDLVDISKHQLDLAKNLVAYWDGVNYGNFVHNFLKKNKVHHRHLQFDTEMEESDKLGLIANKQYFCQYVNDRFMKKLNEYNISPGEFIQHWSCMSQKKISYHNTNMVDWLMSAELSSASGVWLSNIMHYKYTWLKSTEAEILRCQDRLTEIECRVLK